jgi:chromosome partitioning protein
VFVVNRKIVNTALARAVYDALGNFDCTISDASLCQRVAYAESAMRGLAVVETAPRSEAAREITTLARLLTSQMTTKARAA